MLICLVDGDEWSADKARTDVGYDLKEVLKYYVPGSLSHGPGKITRVRRATPSARSLDFVEAPGVEPARRMIENPSAAPTCTVIPRAWRFREGAGEGG
jgi:hypothetical protein